MEGMEGEMLTVQVGELTTEWLGGEGNSPAGSRAREGGSGDRNICWWERGGRRLLLFCTLSTPQL